MHVVRTEIVPKKIGDVKNNKLKIINLLYYKIWYNIIYIVYYVSMYHKDEYYININISHSFRGRNMCKVYIIAYLLIAY